MATRKRADLQVVPEPAFSDVDEELDLDDLDDLELDLVEEEPAPVVKAPVKKKVAPKPAPAVVEEAEDEELDFEDLAFSPEDEAEDVTEVPEPTGVTPTKAKTRKAAPVVSEPKEEETPMSGGMIAFTQGFVAGKYGVNLTEERAADVVDTLTIAGVDYNHPLLAKLVGSSVSETASATVVKSPGVTQVVKKAAKPASVAKAKKAAPAKAGGNPSDMRAWVRANGWPDLGDRGRIPADGQAAYNAAH